MKNERLILMTLRALVSQEMGLMRKDRISLMHKLEDAIDDLTSKMKNQDQTNKEENKVIS